MYRPFVYYETEEEYEDHFRRVYCNANPPVVTFDNIRVQFSPWHFRHAFYRRVFGGPKNVFSLERARRIDWIAEALRDGVAELHLGWDAEKERHREDRRSCLVGGNYLVVIQFTNGDSATLITAYVVSDQPTLARIKNDPRWDSKRKKGR
jgi:hypothetical protein